SVDVAQPELMLREPHEALQQASVIAIGPGLGQSKQAGELLERALFLDLPRIVDADGLNLLAQAPQLLRQGAAPPAPIFARIASRAPLILTPHPAEAARLLGCLPGAIQADRLAAALELACRFNAYVVLKGCGTIIATPDGHWFINTSGNPGLASAGTGDVLTGMVAALLAQHWPPLEALLAAVHLHGAAAEACAAEGRGPVGLAAGELIDAARRILNRWITELGC
ncbi:MAG: NAD(P)H-hydrate dehydratase, partial [Rhodocyclaceae bacterium]